MDQSAFQFTKESWSVGFPAWPDHPMLPGQVASPGKSGQIKPDQARFSRRSANLKDLRTLRNCGRRYVQQNSGPTSGPRITPITRTAEDFVRVIGVICWRSLFGVISCGSWPLWWRLRITRRTFQNLQQLPPICRPAVGDRESNTPKPPTIAHPASLQPNPAESSPLKLN